MALEPITRQEQIVAGKELEPITRMERFLKDYGVSKYFGETTVKGDTLTWDGNDAGLITTQTEYEKFCLVADTVVTLDDAHNGITLKIGDDEPFTVDYESLVEISSEVGTLCCDGAFFVPTDNYEYELYGLVFPKAGVWVIALGMPVAITIPGYNGFETTTIKPIETKYLPPLVSPSGKKFKLSVDDSGVLSATEV